jgi:hypothetical protein
MIPLIFRTRPKTLHGIQLHCKLKTVKGKVKELYGRTLPFILVLCILETMTPDVILKITAVVV